MKTTLKTRLTRFGRMTLATLRPIWTGEGEGRALAIMNVMTFPILFIPTFVAVVVFDR